MNPLRKWRYGWKCPTVPAQNVRSIDYCIGKVFCSVSARLSIETALIVCWNIRILSCLNSCQHWFLNNTNVAKYFLIHLFGMFLLLVYSYILGAWLWQCLHIYIVGVSCCKLFCYSIFKVTESHLMCQISCWTVLQWY